MSNQFAIKLILLFLVVGVSHEMSIFDSIIDGIASQALPIGEPLDDNMNTMKFKCDSAKSGYFQTIFDNVKYGINEESILFKMGVAVLRDGMDPDKNLICALLKEGEWKKAQTIVREVNKHVSKGKAVLSQLQAVFKDASKENTTITFPTLICLIRAFQRKYSDVFPETDGAKMYVKSTCDVFFGSITGALELATEIGAKKCKLPPPSAQRSEYKSVLIGLKKAIENLESKLKNTNASGKTSYSWGIFGG